MSNRNLLLPGAVAAASLGLYLLLALRYPITPSLSDPRASWTSMVEANRLNAAQHLGLYLGLNLLYLVMLRLLAPSPKGSKVSPSRQILLVFVTWLACSAILLTIAPAGESHDIFDYLFRGRMMTEYRANPLVDIPGSFNKAPYYQYLAWYKNVDSYGPIWEASSAIVALSVRQVAHWFGWWWEEGQAVCPRAPESCRLLVMYITGYRLSAISLTGLSGWLIVKITRHNHDSSTLLALATWLLNPLTLIATSVGGHNDTLMLVLVLLGWWLLQRQHLYMAIIALILAAHVKLTAMIWLPACLLWIARQWGWRRTLRIGLLSAVSGMILSWLLYAPFGGWRSLPGMLQERSAFLANSFWRVVKHLLDNNWGWQTESAHQLSVGLSGLLFVVGALLVPLYLFNIRPKHWQSEPIPLTQEDSAIWRALTAVSMLYLLVGSFWFQHWYVLWALLPAALLSDSQWIRSLILWLAFGALSSNVAMDFLQATVLKTSPLIVKYILVVAIIWGPVLIAAIFLVLTRWRKRLHTHNPSLEVTGQD